MLVRLCSVLLLLAATVQASGLTRDDLKWARRTLHARRLARRAAPSATVGASSQIVTGALNDCPAYGDATFTRSSREFQPDDTSDSPYLSCSYQGPGQEIPGFPVPIPSFVTCSYNALGVQYGSNSNCGTPTTSGATRGVQFTTCPATGGPANEQVPLVASGDAGTSLSIGLSSASLSCAYYNADRSEGILCGYDAVGGGQNTASNNAGSFVYDDCPTLSRSNFASSVDFQTA